MSYFAQMVFIIRLLTCKNQMAFYLGITPLEIISCHQLRFTTRVQSAPSHLIPWTSWAPCRARVGPGSRVVWREDRFHMCKDIPLTLVKSPCHVSSWSQTTYCMDQRSWRYMCLLGGLFIHGPVSWFSLSHVLNTVNQTILSFPAPTVCRVERLPGLKKVKGVKH